MGLEISIIFAISEAPLYPVISTLWYWPLRAISNVDLRNQRSFHMAAPVSPWDVIVSGGDNVPHSSFSAQYGIRIQLTPS
jgi:hypothetical protein